MKNEKIKYSIISIISIALLVCVAIFSYSHRITEDTDIIILSQYIFEGMNYWYVMLLGIVAETAIVKWLLKESLLKSTAITLLMNAVSTVLGFVALHIASLIVEVLLLALPFGSFHVSHWIANFIIVIFMNACLEGLTVKIGFKYKFKKIFSSLLLANAVSFVICFLCNLSWIGEMFF